MNPFDINDKLKHLKSMHDDLEKERKRIDEKIRSAHRRNKFGGNLIIHPNQQINTSIFEELEILN